VRKLFVLFIALGLSAGLAANSQAGKYVSYTKQTPGGSCSKSFEGKWVKLPSGGTFECGTFGASNKMRWNYLTLSSKRIDEMTDHWFAQGCVDFMSGSFPAAIANFLPAERYIADWVGISYGIAKYGANFTSLRDRCLGSR